MAAQKCLRSADRFRLTRCPVDSDLLGTLAGRLNLLHDRLVHRGQIDLAARPCRRGRVQHGGWAAPAPDPPRWVCSVQPLVFIAGFVFKL